MPLFELYEGFFVDPDLVAVVKATGDDQCALFTSGQSAVDGGFAIPYAAAEVVEKINDESTMEEVEDNDEDEAEADQELEDEKALKALEALEAEEEHG